MPGLLYAVVTVLAWGSWLVPSQNVVFRNQQIKTFYIAVANLPLSLAILLFQGVGGFTWSVFWPPFLGGLVWSVSAFLAFTATERLGIARAYGLWAPVNVLVSFLWGIIVFGEMLNAGPLTLLLLALALLICLAGMLLIIFAKGASGDSAQSHSTLWAGLLAALGVGVLWGSYFVPIKLSAASMWVATFPLSVGILVGSVILVVLPHQRLQLARRSDYLRVASSGLLWGIGNYGMLLLVDQLGAGRGFTIAQLGIVVNGLFGIYALKDPPPRSRASTLTLVGCACATVGGILLGGLK